ncbi:MAG: NmrA family NAD(P)-binding protein [Umezawaea sp.]
MSVLVLVSTWNIVPQVVSALLERGAEVRVLARDTDRARAVLPGAVEVVGWDPADEGGLRAAAEGAESLLLLTGHGLDMADTQLRVLRAVRRLPVRVVKLSATSSTVTPDGPHVGRQHWEVEQVLHGGGTPFVVLRPNAFSQVIVDQLAGAARTTGVLPNPLGDAGISVVDARDVGAVAAHALTSDAWNGETLVLTGPRAVTYPQLAELVSAATDAPLTVVDVPLDAVRDAQIARGVPLWETDHRQEMFDMFARRESAFVTNEIRRITGTPPRDVATCVAEAAAAGAFTRVPVPN